MKQTRLRRILSLAVMGLLVLQLAGCGGKAPEPAAPASSAVPSDLGEPSAPAGTEAAGAQALPEPTVVHPVNLMAEITPRPAEPGPVAAGAATAAADFGVRLFRAGYQPGKNTLISPLSVLCALAMTANGAAGATQMQMESTLGLRTGLLNEFFQAWLARQTGEDSCLRPANSIWFTDDPRFTVNPGFLQTNADFYGADIYRLPLDETGRAAINDWVREKTAGMIPTILDQIPPAAVMYLVNALAFEAKWADPYPEHAVVSGEFKLESGETRPVEFMNSTEHLYLEDDNATGFIKPYAGGRWAFAALMPKEGLSLEDYGKTLDGASLQRLLAEPQTAPVTAALPKFETEFGMDLVEVLQTMDLELPFDSNRADFSGLGASTGGNIYISRVLHKTFLSVAEQGTRAGAATAVEMSDRAISIQDRKEVILDRPFLYLLIDTENNLPIFIGALLEP